MPDRRNPFEGVTDFVSELSRLRSLGVHGALESSGDNPERTHASAWVPSTDILATGDDLVIRIELAGVDPADVDLRFNHGVLTVSGARQAGEAEHAEDATFLVRERYHGEFRRAITLPDDVTPEQIEATFEDGLVTIVVQGAATDRDGSRIEIAHRGGARKSRRVQPS
ncbi:Hsp20/alpha crystallin family protein [Nocardioides sp. zg-1308]|uniref:Hsp20/alpha crystallin family protein n=1 Tax=Nocardioides renjunii TaxID=3095075 RepID=A0ABU5KDH3_9ACTN|nr:MULTISPECIES: Hsp20/alpha crystallin family protein [unclassified Nocardioides]MDZ5662899.1 Hsp20/alpha crystallin family protein [Nocardioides sp. S-58]NPD05433.1 Hsp20/alpha crystallin family protein [Nocardioides sp. zg-1308]WQQ23321.1 Hsp20/alpha crystallin family protein [Nocardioides sp. S-34]